MEFITNLQNRHDDQKPSLFDILAENQLSTLLPPSIRYLLVLATHRHPRYLLRILNSYDEIYAVVSLLVERYFLRSYGGTFTENFYGLKRERMLSVKNGEVPRAQIGAQSLVRDALKLKNSDVWKNLAIIVGIPYLKRKLDESYDTHAAHYQVLGQTGGNDHLPPNPTVKQRLMHWYKWFLRKVYPSINAAFWFSTVMFNLAYLFDGTKYSSPLLWLIGTRIRRMSPADYKAISEAEGRAAARTSALGSRPSLHTSLFNPRSMGRIVVPALLSSLRLLLPASIFALKFLEWWHASDFPRLLSRKATEGLELPPPIIRKLPTVALGTGSNSAQDGEERDQKSAVNEKQPLAENESSPPTPTKRVISRSSGLPIFTIPAPIAETSGYCPICGDVIVNPTAAPSGYVYCYVCIHRWVEGEHDRQTEFMEAVNRDGGDSSHSEPESSVEDDDDDDDDRYGDRDGYNSDPDVRLSEGSIDDSDSSSTDPKPRSSNRWENGKGRCAVTGMLILGGTESLRRVIV